MAGSNKIVCSLTKKDTVSKELSSTPKEDGDRSVERGRLAARPSRITRRCSQCAPLHLPHRYNMRLAVVRGIVSLQTPHPNSSQPAMKVRPPTGVTAPNHRIPARDTPYRLPENRRIPRINSHPDF